LLGLQFGVLFDNDLYYKVAAHANGLADKIRAAIRELGYDSLVENTTNQVFPIFPDALLAELSKEFCFTEMERIDENHRAIRFCTSWATTEEDIRALEAIL
jgi:threonine aldolase